MNQSQPQFILADYNAAPFPNEFFDSVIFCESLTHSIDKNATLLETLRILKNGGSFVLSDTFVKKRTLTQGDIQNLEDLKQGWCLPSVLFIEDFIGLIAKIGYKNIRCMETTKSIINSTRRMKDHAEKRLVEDTEGTGK